ncbi:hypothetical protein [Bifidobacterium leontopitheci]|uniref:ABC transporter ATP-binding protein n=1 Tax=Bifidobacterium leontopitheci TaxID=2650774 RepID=A0A6I1GQ97_9BIFI|nr:hypothetical protein [Bifidobacterium leontopitheci]KAB7788701.1 ABC transporter ATP-binding protein [Bifidobacterium leontopitheci]
MNHLPIIPEDFGAWMLSICLVVLPVAYTIMKPRLNQKHVNGGLSFGAGLGGLLIGFGLNMIIYINAHSLSNGLAYFGLFGGGVVLIIIGINLIAAMFREVDGAKAVYLEQQERELRQSEVTHSIGQVASDFDIPRVPDTQPNYRGYRLIMQDAGGDPSPLWQQYHDKSTNAASHQYRLFGDPGVGLNASGFDRQNVRPGQKGEQLFARIIANMPELNVLSFWSLHGIDQYGFLIDADIDCMLIGIDQKGVTHRWFVDVKNYKGGADTMYINENEHSLMRVSRTQHAFILGPDGKPVIGLSDNMNRQRDNWNESEGSTYGEMRRLITGECNVLPEPVDEWVVCMTGGEHGTPLMADVYWPGHIRAVSMEQLIAEIADLHLAYPANIPDEFINHAKGMLKNPHGKPREVAPWVNKELAAKWRDEDLAAAQAAQAAQDER